MFNYIKFRAGRSPRRLSFRIPFYFSSRGRVSAAAAADFESATPDRRLSFGLERLDEIIEVYQIMEIQSYVRTISYWPLALSKVAVSSGGTLIFPLFENRSIATEAGVPF